MIRNTASQVCVTRNRSDRVPGARRARSRDLEPRSFGLTDRGRDRASNEDHFALAELLHPLGISHASVTFGHGSETRGNVFIVADGVGGGRAGDRASALAVRAVGNCLAAASSSLLGENHARASWVLETALSYADHALL